MKKSLVRVGRASIMGLAWAAAWVPIGCLAGVLIVGELDPEWIGGPLYSGFLCGAIFSALGGFVDRRRLALMSVSAAGARGLISGLLAGSLWLIVVLLSDPPKWLFEGGVVGLLGILSCVSGAAAASVARMGSNHASAHAASS